MSKIYAELQVKVQVTVEATVKVLVDMRHNLELFEKVSSASLSSTRFLVVETGWWRRLVILWERGRWDARDRRRNGRIKTSSKTVIKDGNTWDRMNKWERWISGSSWRESRSVQGRESWRKRGKELGIMMASGKAEWAGQKAEADRGMEGKGPMSARGAVWRAWVAEGQIGAAGKKADETGVRGGAAWWPGRTEPPGNKSKETGYLLHLHTLLLMLTNPWINHVHQRRPWFTVLKI